MLRAWIDRYDESLFYLDEQVGRLLDELARLGTLDSTIVVFTSDHGENWGEHDLIYHGHSLYQEQIRIPLIVRFPPRVTPGTRSVAPVALEQLPLLITDLAGIAGAPFPGLSFDSYTAAGANAVAVSEVGRRRGVPPSWPTASGGLRSLQTERWQLIESDVGRVELYDLETDPRQLKNLASDPRFADVLASMRGRLAAEVPAPGPRAQAEGTSSADSRAADSSGTALPRRGLRPANRRAHTPGSLLAARPNLANPSPVASFPALRARRLRAKPWIRALVQESRVDVSDLIWAIVVHDGREARVPVPSMPGTDRLSVGEAARAAEQAQKLGIPAIAVFPHIDAAKKDRIGSEATNPKGVVCDAVRAMKTAAPGWASWSTSRSTRSPIMAMTACSTARSSTTRVSSAWSSRR